MQSFIIRIEKSSYYRISSDFDNQCCRIVHQVPYEILNKKFRIAQKTLDREFCQIQSAASELEKSLADGQTAGEISRLLGGVVERLQALKRKADESIGDELTAGIECKRRLDHLRQCTAVANYNGSTPHTNGNSCGHTSSNGSNGRLSMSSLSPVVAGDTCSVIPMDTSDDAVAGPLSAIPMVLLPASVVTTASQWRNMRLDRMIVEHLLRLGYYESAERLADRTHIRDLTNVDIFRVSRDVEADLRSHKTAKCAAWCADNKSKLRKISSTIEFQLRVQEFVELIRSDKRLEAVMHARRTFAAFEAEQMPEIRQCMGLLAFPVHTEMEPYRSLFDKSRWTDLVLKFRSENYRLFQLSSQSVLGVAVQAGLSALKTPQCYSQCSKNLNCPVCQQNFNEMAEHLPFSHCAQSRLICRLTGEPLNEHNLPMMLPNGQVYGQMVSAAAEV